MYLTLHSCFSKIDHAQRHLETLKDEIETWVNGHPYALFTQHEAGADTHTFRFFLGEVFDAPDPVGLIFGDYVHNLRSALDHLVWALAVNNKGGKEPKNANAVGFPVADNPGAFYDAPVLRHLTWEQATVLEGFQPYHGGTHQKRSATSTSSGTMTNTGSYNLFSHGSSECRSTTWRTSEAS